MMSRKGVWVAQELMVEAGQQQLGDDQAVEEGAEFNLACTVNFWIQK